MNYYNNTRHLRNYMIINNIKYYNSRKFFCPIGKSACTYNFTVEFTPMLVIPDYLVIDELIDGLSSELTIEDALNGVFNIFLNEVNPLELKVTCMCDDARHSKVEVTKELRHG